MVFHHIALTCNDALAVEAFYVKHFGFRRARAVSLGEGKQIVFIRAGDTYLELFQTDDAPPVPKAGNDGPGYPGWRHIAFKVDNLDATLAAMGDAAKLSLGPFDFDAFIPGWRTVWLADPEGNIVEVSQGYVDEEPAPSA